MQIVWEKIEKHFKTSSAETKKKKKKKKKKNTKSAKH